MIITRAHPSTLGMRKRTIERTISLGPLSFRFVTIALLSVLALFYLIQSSQGESNSFRVNELETEKEKLVEEMKRLELESIRLRSLNEIRKNAGTMEPVEQVNQLPTTPPTSATTP